ncbi:hypothetical protein [Halococcus sp. IIIV-5B]|uniref:hypothetical protein n=1 Tax=Halococcus sp. IIIV-5B TaxID=2321230 RepID=UPI000E7294D9|nr:hypothetical protein [Halococcus sp. IIIV-5B]RJS97059.1 hypothetical protein D3261_18500 [Halococcus sp. IIIV-5B]
MDDGIDFVLVTLRTLSGLFAVLAMIVGNGGQRLTIAIAGVVVLVASVLGFAGVRRISRSRIGWLVVLLLLVVLIVDGILHPAVPPVGIPTGR